ALSVLCRGSTEEKMRLCFDLYDVDKSGYLCVEKMINMAASLCEIYQNKVAPVPLVVLAPPNAPAPRRASASAHGVNQGGESDPPASGPTRRKGRSCSSDATHRWNSPSFGSLCDGVDHRHDGDPDEYEASLLDRYGMLKRWHE
ncbi:hypothetical protein B5M09_008672, partial [Aphanomyces astaci]